MLVRTGRLRRGFIPNSEPLVAATP
jgi:hypothetical protein